MANSGKQKYSKTQKYIVRKGIDRAVIIASSQQVSGITVTSVKVADGYHGLRYSLERMIFGGVAGVMENYLAKRPHMSFDHPKNLARKALHAMPSFSHWSTLISNTGSLAMEPLHNPSIRRLAGGKRLDPLTRRMFRHGSDPIGIRTRTVTAGWLAHHYVGQNNENITWVSLAGAYAGPSMLMIDAAGIDKRTLSYVNIDANASAIASAKVVTELAGLNPSRTDLINGDIFDEKILSPYAGRADVVEMMGIFEYFDEAQAAKLMKLAYSLLKPGGRILSCNMRTSHPQLNLHKRGVGWPGVIQRDTGELIILCRRAGLSSRQVSIYQPHDGVYNILCIEKD